MARTNQIQEKENKAEEEYAVARWATVGVVRPIPGVPKLDELKAMN
jgi:hypothetical protein